MHLISIFILALGINGKISENDLLKRSPGNFYHNLMWHVDEMIPLIGVDLILIDFKSFFYPISRVLTNKYQINVIQNKVKRSARASRSI